MSVYELLRNYPASYGACWSQEHLCYMLRRDHILVLATLLFGSSVRAHQWLHNKALGLNYLAPCSLLSSRGGYKTVRDFLVRVQYGVYC